MQLLLRLWLRIPTSIIRLQNMSQRMQVKSIIKYRRRAALARYMPSLLIRMPRKPRALRALHEALVPVRLRQRALHQRQRLQTPRQQGPNKPSKLVQSQFRGLVLRLQPALSSHLVVGVSTTATVCSSLHTNCSLVIIRF